MHGIAAWGHAAYIMTCRPGALTGRFTRTDKKAGLVKDSGGENNLRRANILDLYLILREIVFAVGIAMLGVRGNTGLRGKLGKREVNFLVDLSILPLQSAIVLFSPARVSTGRLTIPVNARSP
ncbi:MAG: hypothetical protein KJ726_05840 [Verrucomicrobia bacterium]|nr:hypothetical protein [Verrucomicrobiota bacterium]MBU1909546.1 hypothetical protein [Verrucomicrobiota bacterium]